MHTFRTRFASDILTEFLPPSRISKKTRVIIFADGMPSVPNKKTLLEFFSKKGFWVFAPRYRGSWESCGKLLAQSPHKDILDVISGITTGFDDLWNTSLSPHFKKKSFQLIPNEIILIGSSFGGPAMLLASLDERVSNTVVISPVIDWRKPGPDESLNFLIRFTEQAFGQGYRVANNGWKKIKSGQFYNPINHANKIDGTKLLILHAKDDRICRYSESKKFATMTKARLVSIPTGGHLAASVLLKPRYYKAFRHFIDQKNYEK